MFFDLDYFVVIIANDYQSNFFTDVCNVGLLRDYYTVFPLK